MERQYIQKALKLYGVNYSNILPSQKGYRNENHPVVLRDGTTLNLIIYKREAGIAKVIKNANYVGDFLADHGQRVRRTYDPRILKLQNSQDTRYASLYRYLPGSTIAWEAYTMVRLKALGNMMASMHAILTELPYDGLPAISTESLSLCVSMQTYFNDAGVKNALNGKLGLVIDETILNHFCKLLILCNQLPNQQALHMDFVRGNVLFDGKAISGIIDFEKTAFGHPYFDIARTLAFLLVDCKFKDETKIRKYFLTSGYNKLHITKPIVINKTYDLLEDLVDFFLLHDLYKFLRHNPYENLNANEHYIRTRDLLVSRNKDVKMTVRTKERV